jgi:hypothetical protein
MLTEARVRPSYRKGFFAFAHFSCRALYLLAAADLERPWIKNTRHCRPPFPNAEEHLEVLHKFTKVDPQDPAARIACGIQK